MAAENLRETRRLGATGPTVFPIALGCMGMSGMYGDSDEKEGIATIHAALERGINLLDTGDFYGMGHNELLIGRALREHRDKALLSVKFGGLRGPDGSFLGVDTRPIAIEEFPRVHAHAARRRSRGHLPTCTPRSQGAHRGDRRRHRRSRQSRLRTRHRSLRGRRRHHPARACRAPGRRSADRILRSSAAVQKSASFRPSKSLGIGVTAYGVLSRGLLSGWKPGRKGRFSLEPPAVQRSKRRAQREDRGHARQAGRREERDAGAARPRVGTRQEQEYRTGHGRTHARPARRNVGSTRRRAVARAMSPR